MHPKLLEIFHVSYSSLNPSHRATQDFREEKHCHDLVLGNALVQDEDQQRLGAVGRKSKTATDVT